MFVGFSPDLVAGVYVGYDQPRSLGSRESGARAALPAWKQFMAEALAGTPARPFRVPPDVRLRWVSEQTGKTATADDKGAILEAFKGRTRTRRNPCRNFRDTRALLGGVQFASLRVGALRVEALLVDWGVLFLSPRWLAELRTELTPMRP